MATIAVDLDGVCYEWHRTYIYMMKHYRDVEFPGDWREWWTTWDSPDEFTTEKDRKWMWSEGVRLGLFRHGHVTQDAIVSLVELAYDHRLEVATHRPTTAIRDTVNWLDHHFGSLNPYPWMGVHLLTDRESKTIVNADILIDDKLENIEDWATYGRDAILFDRPWNQATEIHGEGTVIRAKGWSEVVQLLRKDTG